MGAKAKRSYPVGKGKAYQAAAEAVTDIGWGTLSSDPTKAEITAQTGYTLRSYGEKVLIKITGSDSHSEITAHSTADWQLFAWGKNEENLAIFFNNVDRGLLPERPVVTQERQVGGSQMGTAMIVCNNCGTNVYAGATFCLKCGAAITSSACRACGEVLAEGSRFCGRCGAAQIQNPATANSNTAVSGQEFFGFSPYYQQEFRQIKASGEAFKGKWNWAAFLFGGIWRLTKGLWL
jgi:RNA polymerase subunit RPABC4/transcription elongation factor Spt4